MNTKYATAPDENGTSYFGTVNPKNNKIVPVGKNITVTNKFVDIDTGDVEFTLEYVNLNAPPTPVTTNGKQLIDDLNRKGYLVGKNTSDIVTDYVREQLDDLQPIKPGNAKVVEHHVHLYRRAFHFHRQQTAGWNERKGSELWQYAMDEKPRAMPGDRAFHAKTLRTSRNASC